MSWLCAALVVIFVLDALQLWRRVTGFKKVVADSGAGAHQTYRLIAAPGVVIDAATTQSAVAFAQAQGLEVLDLVPVDLPTLAAISLIRWVDPAHYRTQCFSRGYTTGHALLVHHEVLKRAGASDITPNDPVALACLAAKLKRYACTTTDVALVPGLRAVKENLACRLTVLREARGGPALLALVVQPCIVALLVWATISMPLWGLLALAAYHLQPLIALGNQRLHPPDLLMVTLGRVPIELWRWLRTVCGWWRMVPAPDAAEVRRSEYSTLLAEGIERFFEPRRDTCPLCDSEELTLQVSMPDFYQCKPGRFRLERCETCRHIFQNPRLSLAGLDFYYKDYYDGLGQETFEFVFDCGVMGYLARARLLAGRMEPKRWLDVGAGHGHFCCAARQVWPQTTFDGLDFSASVDEGVRRRWIDTGYRGLFPDLAPQLTATYEVVSMSHYLEHTRDPQAELEAARRVLTCDGYLLIEVPDPDCALNRLLGQFWYLWSQPQHQHFLSVTNLAQLLAQHGFKPVVWQRGEAHWSLDIGMAVLFLVRRLAPRPNRPWLPLCSRGHRLGCALIWSVGLPLVLLGLMLDVLLIPLFRRPGLSNVYRVLAQRRKDDTGVNPNVEENGTRVRYQESSSS